MARPLARRVARLERAGSPACPACGGGGPGPVTFRVVVPEAVGRVARLEARPGGPRGPCRYCLGSGVFALVDEAEGQTAADAAGCPSCGRVSKLIVLGAGEGQRRG